jgi:hypothetical protein
MVDSTKANDTAAEETVVRQGNSTSRRRETRGETREGKPYVVSPLAQGLVVVYCPLFFIG